MKKEKIILFLANVSEWCLYVTLLAIPCSKALIEVSVSIAIAAWIAIIWGFDATSYYLDFFNVDWTTL